MLSDGVPEGASSSAVDGRTVSIKASHEASDVEGAVVFLRGCSFGSVRRQLTPPEGLDLEAITARYDNGVLTVTLPVAESAKPRKVAIQHGTGAREITQG